MIIDMKAIVIRGIKQAAAAAAVSKLTQKWLHHVAYRSAANSQKFALRVMQLNGNVCNQYKLHKQQQYTNCFLTLIAAERR